MHLISLGVELGALHNIEYGNAGRQRPGDSRHLVKSIRSSHIIGRKLVLSVYRTEQGIVDSNSNDDVSHVQMLFYDHWGFINNNARQAMNQFEQHIVHI